MSSTFERVALIGKYHAPQRGARPAQARDALRRIAAFLCAQGCKVVLDSESALRCALHDSYAHMGMDALGRACDLAVVIGGDGTMLGAGRLLAQHGTPLIGINQGRLGFVTDIALTECEAALAPMLRGEYEEDERALMRAQVWREGACVFEALAMNDVVMHRGGASGMMELRVEVGGRFVSNQRADGLIVATPTGSTAYALSVGGPLLHPSIPAWVMAPIAPHQLSNRPIVLSSASEVTMQVVGGSDVNANFDMQSLTAMRRGDRIVVSRADISMRFLHPRGWNYFATLRKKLGWNEGGV